MKLFLSALIVCGWVADVLATHTTTRPSITTKPSTATNPFSTTNPFNVSCRSTAYAGFREISGIANFCETAYRPTVTVTAQRVTILAASPVFVVRTVFRFTNTVFTVPVPTKTACATSSARFAAFPVSTEAAGSFVLNKVIAAATVAPANAPAGLERRTYNHGKHEKCPLLKDSIKSACSCFFSAGAEQTVTFNGGTTTVFTATTTVKQTLVTEVPHTRTLAQNCAATNVPVVFGNASYNVCGSDGLPGAEYSECSVAVPLGSPELSFDALDCCSACSNTLDCFQAYTDQISNICRLDIRTGFSDQNSTFAPGCPNHLTNVNFGDPRDNGLSNFPTGYLRGQCAHGC